MEYRLQVLLELRERSKKECERMLAVTLAALAVENKKLEDMLVVLQQLQDEQKQRREKFLEKAMQQTTEAFEAKSNQIYLDRLRERELLQKEAITTQRGIIALKQKDVDEARLQLIKADQALKAIEKHKENFITEQRKERERKQEEVMNEIAQTIHQRNQQNG